MQLIGLAALCVALLSPMPAWACALSVGTVGTLKLSADGQQLGSNETGGVPATLTVSNALLDGDFRLTVARPTVIGPSGFDNSAALTFVSYTGTGLFSSHGSGGFLDHASSFDMTGLLNALSVTMTIHNRVTTPKGFTNGTYQTKTVITCTSL